MSSFNLAKGFSKPIDASCLPISCPPELIVAHESLVVKRKLTLMLRSNMTEDPK